MEASDIDISCIEKESVSFLCQTRKVGLLRCNVRHPPSSFIGFLLHVNVVELCYSHSELARINIKPDSLRYKTEFHISIKFLYFIIVLMQRHVTNKRFVIGMFLTRVLSMLSLSIELRSSFMTV